MIEVEEWKDIPGYEGYYQVSNMGQVKSLSRTISTSSGRKVFYKGRLLIQSPNQDGYPMVSLCRDGTQVTIKIHLLVARNYIPNPENKPTVNHKNGIKTDNRAKNLEWATNAENTRHALNNELIKPRKGVEHHNCRLTEKEVIEIRNNNLNLTAAELGRRYKTSDDNIRRIVLRKNWKHIL